MGGGDDVGLAEPAARQPVSLGQQGLELGQVGLQRLPPGAQSPREFVAVDVTQDLYAIEADEFAAAVLDGVKPRISQSDTLGNMRVLDAIRKQIGLSFS